MARSKSHGRWCVLYRAARTGPADPWLLVNDVEPGSSREQVLDALRASPLWPRWTARMDIDGRLVVRRWVAGDGELVFPAVIDWPALVPGARRLSVPLDGALHARCRRAAAAAGQSLVQWSTAALVAHLGGAE